MQLANEYLDGAALAGVSGSSMPENLGAKVEEVRRTPTCHALCGTSGFVQSIGTFRPVKPSAPRFAALVKGHLRCHFSSSHRLVDIWLASFNEDICDVVQP